MFQINGSEEQSPARPREILLCLCFSGICVASGKLARRVEMNDSISGGIGNILKPGGTCSGTDEKRSEVSVSSEM